MNWVSGGEVAIADIVGWVDAYVTQPLCCPFYFCDRVQPFGHENSEARRDASAAAIELALAQSNVLQFEDLCFQFLHISWTRCKRIEQRFLCC